MAVASIEILDQENIHTLRIHIDSIKSIQLDIQREDEE